jgi:Asp-tRNA(Asn)/Glu-tRNA(Gln) amidotransferase A subunit family amidase
MNSGWGELFSRCIEGEESRADSFLFPSSANFHSHFGPTLNPAGSQGVDTTLASESSEQRVAGGSSGGSAAAVAADLCDL